MAEETTANRRHPNFRSGWSSRAEVQSQVPDPKEAGHHSDEAVGFRALRLFGRRPASAALKATRSKALMRNSMIGAKRRASPQPSIWPWLGHCAHLW
jgi:hypothetical protein